MHSFLTYLHLTHRIERDLILLAALTEGDTNGSNNASILHLLSGVLQSLSQTLTLAIVDESPDLSTALTLRLSHAKAERALQLARAYAHATQKRYAEAVALTQRGHLHVREARATLSILPAESTAHVEFYPIDEGIISALEQRLIGEEEGYKRSWFAEGGEGEKKPVFFDIAFNYVEPPIEQLRLRAGLTPAAARTVDTSPRVTKAKAETEAEAAASPASQPASRGLGGFLGSWWGRR